MATRAAFPNHHNLPNTTIPRGARERERLPIFFGSNWTLFGLARGERGKLVYKGKISVVSEVGDEGGEGGNSPPGSGDAVYGEMA